MKKFIILFLTLVNMTAHASGELEACVNNVYRQPEWYTKIQELVSSEGTEPKQGIITKNRTKLYNLLAENFLKFCSDDLIKIFSSKEKGKMYFDYKTDLYALEFDLSELQKYLSIEAGILVIDNTKLSPGDTLQKPGTPTDKRKFFSNNCSTHVVAWPRFNYDAAVNKAAQKAFGDTDNYFFLDFAQGDDGRAFPGLVLMDKSKSPSERIVTFSNLATGKEKTEAFAKELQQTYTACRSQGLAVYTVALTTGLNESPDKSAAKTLGWGLITGTVGMTAYLLSPEKIRNIDQVVILSDPYILN